MWDLIVSVPDHCLSFYFPIQFGTTYMAFNECIFNSIIKTLLGMLFQIINFIS